MKIIKNIKNYAILLAADDPSGIFPKKSLREKPENLTFDDIASYISYAIDVLLAVAGAVAVVYLIIGGYRYITAMGNEDQMKTAKTTMIWAVLGLVIVVCAWLIVNEIWGLFHGGDTPSGAVPL